MKVLIVYSSAGSGHRRAAEAIYEYLEDEIKKDSRLVDALDFTHPLFKIIYSDGYTFLIKYLPWVWSFFYWLTDRKSLRLFFNLTRRLVNNIFVRRFFKFAMEVNPDVIISTHFMPNEVISDLKMQKKLSCFLISVITDYTAHSFWISRAVDRYVVAIGEIKDILIKKGLDRDKILVLGIPVDNKFFNLKPRLEAAKTIGIRPERFTCLLVTGTIGLNALGEIAKLLETDIQVLVIHGVNKRLKERLKKDGSPSIFTFPVINNMQDFLAASDIIVTKAGGLTISECLITQTPMFFICKVFGQEAENIKALCSLNCAIYEPNLEKLAKRISLIKDDPNIILRMKTNISRVSKSDANEKIMELIKTHVR